MKLIVQWSFNEELNIIDIFFICFVIYIIPIIVAMLIFADYCKNMTSKVFLFYIYFNII